MLWLSSVKCKYLSRICVAKQVFMNNTVSIQPMKGKLDYNKEGFSIYNMGFEFSLKLKGIYVIRTKY